MDDKKFDIDFSKFPEITQGQLEIYEEKLVELMEGRKQTGSVLVGAVCNAAIAANSTILRSLKMP